MHCLAKQKTLLSSPDRCQQGKSEGDTSWVCDNLKGWDGLGGGKEVQEGGDICTPMSDSC